ncbi:PREDICTED: LOW QUALITY PROTEIN: scale keratin-like [Leptosomus discolor]|uniref:LOW QUALITY PROTEIN: scale keratin-like n=1 Tax=Leptosomus discolor TaxID=188344 RepID=UPI000522A6CF|nr:PREDICTED: LOW QUALITY PROTEIN: scale keratin-like [Leptosomus discolor]
MSYYDLCSSALGGINRPQPLADSGNEPCVRQCPDSTAVIQPPPVIVTFPGPILSSFPQDSVVGSSGAPVLGGYGGSLGYGGLYGYGGPPKIGGSVGCGGLYGYGGSSLGCGGLYGYGSSLGYRGLYGYGRSYGSGSCSPYSYRYNRYSRGICGPC